METQETETSTPAGGEPWFISRPAIILMDLPHAVRWEVTRRHPYYLRFWEDAQRHYLTPSSDPDQREREKVTAQLLLTTLGVRAAPPHPASTAESLGAGNLFQAWESGAVAPQTFRGLASILLVDLPPDALTQVGMLMVQCGTQAEEEPYKKIQFLQELLTLPDPALNGLPNRPVVGINVQAPLRTIAEAVETMARGWKEQLGIGERRRRDDKLDDYLAAWDRREGWVTDRYDGRREQTLREIAVDLHVPVSTVANRYRSAFRLIAGCEYTPALWARVIGFLKASEWLDHDKLPRRTLHRPWRERQPREIPEAALQAPGQGAGATGVLNTCGATQGEIEYTDLVLDIQELIALGRSDAAIVAALELTSPLAEDLIAHMRQRHKDLL